MYSRDTPSPKSVKLWEHVTRIRMGHDMSFLRRRVTDMTFSQRFAHVAVFWGLPMVCLELIGISWSSWAVILLLLIPATLLGVFFYTVIEHWFYSR